MSAWTTPLRPGLPLSFDGEQFTVAEIEGRRILLEPATAVFGTPKWRQVDISVLLAHPSTKILVPVPQEEPPAAAVLGSLDDDGDDALTRRFRHVQEVMTGYQLGDEVLALPGEPRPDYAPTTPLMHRYAAKAVELGVAESTIRNVTPAPVPDHAGRTSPPTPSPAGRQGSLPCSGPDGRCACSRPPQTTKTPALARSAAAAAASSCFLAGRPS